MERLIPCIKVGTKKNEKVLKEVMGHWLTEKPPLINENFAYVVFILKISDNRKEFTIYPVSWRNFNGYEFDYF